VKTTDTKDAHPSGGDPWPVGVYLVAMALVTVVAVVLAAETKHRDLGGGGPAKWE
jgi:hypothetical protein